MDHLGMKGTKWALFTLALDMFADEGYDNVSVRDIANAANIKSSSIYYHFKSKTDILRQLYQFFEHHYYGNLPSLQSLVDAIGREAPRDILLKSIAIYEDSLNDLMDKLFTIVSMQAMCGDPDAEQVLNNTLFVSSQKYIGTLLTIMMERSIIEPMDVEHFTKVFTAFCHSSLLRARSHYPVGRKEWYETLDFLLALVVPCNTDNTTTDNT